MEGASPGLHDSTERGKGRHSRFYRSTALSGEYGGGAVDKYRIRCWAKWGVLVENPDCGDVDQGIG